MWFSNELCILLNEHLKWPWTKEDWDGKPGNKINMLKMLFLIKQDIHMYIFESIDKNAASSLFSRPPLNKPTLCNKPPSWEKKIIRAYTF